MTMNREAFEAWIKADSTLPTDRNEHGYVDMTTALMWHAWQAAATELRRQHAEIDRLTGALKQANSQAEHFEREWYLRGDESERLRADAARYRWLCDSPATHAPDVLLSWMWKRPFGIGNKLDEAIDAAMRDAPND